MISTMLVTDSPAWYDQINSSDEFSHRGALSEITYRYDTESRVSRVAKFIFSCVCFPVGLYNLVHLLAGKIIVLASTPSLLGRTEEDALNKRVNLRKGYIYKRITIAVDGDLIDAVMIGTPKTLKNGKWILSSGGNAEFYESTIADGGSVEGLMEHMEANALVFNYPGVGDSSGWSTRKSMTSAYLAMLSFLEDQDKGVGAKEIIGYGHSIGGGVQGDALETHQFQLGVKYVFVKSRTFSDLQSEVSSIMSKSLGWLIRIFGWNMNPAASSKALRYPEIILQTANVTNYAVLNEENRDSIVHDEVIPAQASLAQKLLHDKEPFVGRKLFVGIPEDHNGLLSNPAFIARHITAMLDEQ